MLPWFTFVPFRLRLFMLFIPRIISLLLPHSRDTFRESRTVISQGGITKIPGPATHRFGVARGPGKLAQGCSRSGSGLLW